MLARVLRPLLALLAAGTAVTAAAAAARDPPLCAYWAAGPLMRCPAEHRCKLWDTLRDGRNVPIFLNTTACQACTPGLGLPLRCARCAPGHVHASYDHFRQECLSVTALGCSATRTSPQAPRPKSLNDGPCTACAPNRKLVWVTARAEDFYKGGSVAGASRRGGDAGVASAAVAAAAAAIRAAAEPMSVALASSAAAQAPVALPADYPFPEMNSTDYDGFTGARTWKGIAVCLSCADLGCPGACSPTAGCTACPAGTVRAAGAPPLDSSLFLGQYKWAWLYGYPSSKAPRLPTLCLDPVKTLRCPPGAWNAAGCTACKAGQYLRPWTGRMLAGSQWLVLRGSAKACITKSSPPSPVNATTNAATAPGRKAVRRASRRSGLRR